MAEAGETGRGGDRPAAHDSGQVGEEHDAAVTGSYGSRSDGESTEVGLYFLN